MPTFIPSGYISIRDALNHLGNELFGSQWTGEEHRARRGLISEEEWLRIKNLPPARGSGAGIERRSGGSAASQTNAGPNDPSDPPYQEEYRARKRYTDALARLRQSLEAGHLEAAILDPWSGKLHQASTSLWRRHDADRMIERGQAPIPRSPNIGSLLLKRFAEANAHSKPLPQAKIQEAIKVLREKTATESLTRPQQRGFLRKTYASYHLTERQLNEIFRAIPTSTGRPRKSGK
jgi:hypothetical protein